MGSRGEREEAENWHGQRIVGERELDFHSDVQAVRRRRRRQNIVFAVLSLLVALVLVLALLVFTGRIQWPGDNADSNIVEVEPISNAQCPQRDFTYQPPQEVRVRVLNSTGEAGLGGRTAQTLEERGFEISLVTSAVSQYSEGIGAVVSGPKGYAQAMSLQRHLPGTVYVFDESKRDAQVDFEVGKEFTELTKLRRLDERPGTLICANPPAEESDEAAG